MSNAKVYLGWHISKKETMPHGDGRKIRPGAVFGVEGPIEICCNGLHASPTLEGAISYVNTIFEDGEPDALVSFVEVWGEVKDQGGKFCGRFRRHVAVGKITYAEQKAIRDGEDGWERIMGEVMARTLHGHSTRSERPAADGLARFKSHSTGFGYDRETRLYNALKRKRNGNGQKKARKAA